MNLDFEVRELKRRTNRIEAQLVDLTAAVRSLLSGGPPSPDRDSLQRIEQKLDALTTITQERFMSVQSDLDTISSGLTAIAQEITDLKNQLAQAPSITPEQLTQLDDLAARVSALVPTAEPPQP